jgi:hypothetical protein
VPCGPVIAEEDAKTEVAATAFFFFFFEETLMTEVVKILSPHEDDMLRIGVRTGMNLTNFFLMKHEERKKVRSIFILEGSTTILIFNTQKTGCVMHKKLLQHGNI